MSDKTPNIKKNFILSTFYQVLKIITPFITTPYVSRVLEPNRVGIYSYTYAYVTYFTLFAALGTVSYGSREIARNRDDKKAYTKLFWEIELLTIITTCACLIGWGIWILFHEKYRIYYIILTLCLFATLFDISWFYTGLEQFKNIVGVNSFFKILSVVAIFLFVKDTGDLAVYILILSLSMVLGNLSMWIYLPKYLLKLDDKKLQIKRHFKETLIYFIPAVATTIYTVLDKTLIGLITKSEYENGYYEQATKIITMAQSVTFTAINSVLGARISYLFAEEKYDEIHRRIKKSMNYILFMGIGICFGLIAVSDRFVPFFFGPGYDKVALLLKLMSPLIIIIGVSNCLGSQYYSPAGLRSTSAKFIVIGSCVNLVCNLCFIPVINSYGAVVATLIAESTISILYLRFCNGYLTMKIIIKQSWKKIIAGVIMLLVIWAINGIFESNILATVVEVVVGVGVYGSCLLFMKDEFIANTFREILSQFVRRKT